MAIQIVQASVNRQNSGSDTTLTLTGVVPGNLIIAFSAGGVSRNPGYTRYNGVYVYKVAQNTTESQLFPNLNDGYYHGIYLIEVSGVDRNNPIISNPFNYINGTSSTIAGVTTVETPAGAISYQMALNQTGATIPSVGSVAPTMTKKTDYTFTQTGNAVRYELFSTDFNPGTRDVVFTGGANTTGILSELLVLNPATTPRVTQGNMYITRGALPTTAPSQGVVGGWGAFAFGAVYGGEVASSGETTTDRTQSANARIQRTIDSTIAGNMRVTAQPERTQSANARILVTVDRTQPANMRVQCTEDRTQQANARILRVEDRTTTANMAIESAVFPASYLQVGDVRIRKDVDQTQIGNMAVLEMQDRVLQANARIQLVTDRTLQGDARISRENLQTINANLRIHAEVSRLQTARASIRRDNLESLIGHALVAKEVLQTISGGMFIIRVNDYDTKPRVGIVDDTPSIGGRRDRSSISVVPQRPGSIGRNERPRVGILRNRP